MTVAGRLALALGALAAGAAAAMSFAARRRAAEGAREEEAVDATIEDSFPASDPPSHTPVTGQKKSQAG